MSASPDRPEGLVLPGRFRAVVFDMDGILLATETLWTAVFEEFVARQGSTLTEASRAGLAGHPLSVVAELIGDLVGRPAPEIATELGAILESHYRAGPPTAEGALRLVAMLASRLPTAVATNTEGDVARAALAASGFDGFSAVVSAADLGHPKPDPAVYVEACRALGVAPADGVAFEDSVLGVRSALGAGMTVIGVPSDGSDLAAAGAHAVIRSLSEVVVE